MLFPADPQYSSPEVFLRHHAAERDRLMQRRNPAERVNARRRAARPVEWR